MARFRIFEKKKLLNDAPVNGMSAVGGWREGNAIGSCFFWQSLHFVANCMTYRRGEKRKPDLEERNGDRDRGREKKEKSFKAEEREREEEERTTKVTENAHKKKREDSEREKRQRRVDF